MSMNITKIGLRAKINFCEDADYTTIMNYFSNRDIIIDEFDVEDEVFWCNDKLHTFLPMKYGTSVYVDYLFVYERPSYNEKYLNVPIIEIQKIVDKFKNTFGIDDSCIRMFGYTWHNSGDEPMDEF